MPLYGLSSQVGLTKLFPFLYIYDKEARNKFLASSELKRTVREYLYNVA